MLAWIAVAAVVTVAVACGGAYLLSRWVGDALDAAPGTREAVAASGLSALRTPASAWWSGDGAYAVVQGVGVDDRPVVSVWDRATDDVRTLAGYRVVAVEPHAPRIWLVPDQRKTGMGEGSAPTTATLLDIAWDGVDAPPTELLSLRLDSDDDPRSDVDARWSAWDGPAGYTVSVEVDVNKGACASALRFGKTRSSLNAWAAKVPTDVVTFEPIGWSPSGRYFAAITQASPATADKVLSRYASSEGTGSAPTYGASLLVFSAADGSLAARDELTVPLHSANSGAAMAAWAGPADTLYHMDLEHDLPTLDALTPDGTDAFVDPKLEGWAEWSDAVWMAGVDGADALVALGGVGGTATDVYRVAGPVPLHEGLILGAVTARWSPAGGMLSVQDDEWSGGWTAYVSTLGGARRRVVDSIVGPDPDVTP